MLITEIKGLLYPDEYITRFFFKEGLHQTPGKVLEFGCGNGNNLMLFTQFGWETVGIDIEKQVLQEATSNFEKVNSKIKNKPSYTFHNLDMLQYVETTTDTPFDVILFPNCINYLSIFTIKKVFQIIAANKMIAPGGKLFLRIRSPKDYRFGKGIKLGNKSYQMISNETNEEGAINTFFSETEIILLLNQFFKYKDLKVLTCDFMNLISEETVFNSDIIIWCTITKE